MNGHGHAATTMPCCLVTGSAGFIGSHLVRAMLNSGLKVIALCRQLSPSTWKNKHPNLHILRRDLSELTPADFNGCSTFVHLAAQMPAFACTLQEYFAVNFTQTLHAFSCAREAGVARCIHIGSCFEFGASSDTHSQLSPRVPLQPMGGYAVSKAAASLALLDWAREQQLRFSLLRLFHIFGPGEKQERFWPSLHRAALAGSDFPMSGGAQVRDFTPVAYAVERILYECTRSDLLPGIPAVRQIGTGRPQTLRRFAEYWWKQWHAPGRLLFGELPYRANEAMRYVPEVEEQAPLEICPWTLED